MALRSATARSVCRELAMACWVAWLTSRMTELAADDFWLSGTDLEDEGVWRWSDGRIFFDAGADAGAPQAFAPWDAQQPNDLNGEDCMRSIGGVWRDLDCSEEIAFVCQR